MELEDLKKLTREDVERMSDDETIGVLVTIATKGSEEMKNKLSWLLAVANHSPDFL